MELLASTLVILMLVTGASFAAPPKKCDKTNVDNCSGRLLMIGDRSFVFPANLDQMNDRCRELKGLESCVKDYTSNCLNKTAKQSMSVLVYSISKTNKGYCSSKRRKNAFLSLSKCAQSQKKKLDAFMDAMNLDFHGIRLYKESKLRIPLACCSYFNLKRKILEVAQEVCPDQVQEFEALVDGYAQDILNLVCGDFTEDSDKCKTIERKTPKWKKAVESKNFVLPLADIFEGLES